MILFATLIAVVAALALMWEQRRAALECATSSSEACDIEYQWRCKMALVTGIIVAIAFYVWWNRRSFDNGKPTSMIRRGSMSGVDGDDDDVATRNIAIRKRAQPRYSPRIRYDDNSTTGTLRKRRPFQENESSCEQRLETCQHRLTKKGLEYILEMDAEESDKHLKDIKDTLETGEFESSDDSDSDDEDTIRPEGIDRVWDDQSTDSESESESESDSDSDDE